MELESGRRESDRGEVRVRIAFDDIMEFSLGLLSLKPSDLDALGWSFADRKRLLDNLLSTGKAAQEVDRSMLGAMPLELTFSIEDVARIRRFARLELPKVATRARTVDRIISALEKAFRPLSYGD